MNSISTALLTQKLTDFLTYERPRRLRLYDYYQGTQDVQKGRIAQGRPNNLLKANMAKYITAVQTGYFMGIPLTFDFDDGVIGEKLNRLMRLGNLDEVFFALARNMGIFGTAYALAYHTPQGVAASSLDPTRCFVIYDDSLSAVPLAGVRLYKLEKYEVHGELYTPGGLQKFIYCDGTVSLGAMEPLFSQTLTMVEFPNNADKLCDFEPVLSLLDAYNLLLSGAMDDMQSVANAFLALYGMQGTTKEDIEAANRSRVLSLSENGRAEFVVKNVNHDAVALLQKTLMDNILQVTMTPDLTDESFGKTQSGVAIEYKLWGIEQARAEKQRNFSKAVRMFLGLLAQMSGLDAASAVLCCNIRFYKNLPQDTGRMCETVATLGDIVSHKTKLELLPFVEDAQTELDRMKAEREE